jgi:hypothetical protein
MSHEPRSVAAPAPTGRHQRRAKNYLLDRHFQLKYTGYLVGIALALSLALGVVLWRTSSRVVEEGRETVRKGQETVDRGKEVLVQSQRVSEVVAMNIRKEYKEDPELAKTFGESAAKDREKLEEEQKRLERDAAFLTRRATDLEIQQRNLLLGLVAVLALLVVGIGMAGIVVTHRVAGPIFKMKRLLRQIGDGKLVLRERLRKGDELQHFFETFERMVEDLRKRQEGEIAKVDRILSKLDTAPVSQRGNKEFDADGVMLLRELRAEMQEHLDA